MAGIYDKPSDCSHPTCQRGECKKCSWNPRSNYAPWHHIGAPGIRYKAPVILATFVAACTVGWVWTMGTFTVLIVSATVIAMIVTLLWIAGV